MTNIHPTAIVESGAELDNNVVVGPYSIIGPNVKIGAGTVIHAHAQVVGHTTVGKSCEIFPYAYVGGKTQDLKYQEGDITYIEIGDNNVIREFCSIHTGTKLGEVTRIANGCLIMAYSHVAHGCVIGNEVILANQSTLAGEVIIEDFAVIGGMTGIHQFCRIGESVMVSGGSRVRQDCPPYMLVDAQAEGKVMGPNVVGLRRRGIGPESRSALKEAFKLLYREGLNRSQALDRIRYELPEVPEIKTLVAFFDNSNRGVI